MGENKTGIKYHEIPRNQLKTNWFRGILYLVGLYACIDEVSDERKNRR